MDNELALRFFAGVPLIGSSGHRLGMLILIDSRPRQLTDQQCAILTNMSGAPTFCYFDFD